MSISSESDFWKHLYRFLPPNVDPGLDFTPIEFLGDQQGLAREKWFYEEILEYDTVKCADDMALLWNGEDHVILVAADISVDSVYGASGGSHAVPTLVSEHATDDVDKAFLRCVRNNIRVEEDNRQHSRSIRIVSPNGSHHELEERGLR